MTQIIIYAFVLLAFICLPLLFIYRRVKNGNKDVKKPLYANLAMFFGVFAVTAGVFLSQGVSAASEAVSTATTMGDGIARAAGYIAAALSVGISGIAGGRAVASSASAAIGALAEDESTFGKAVVFVGMAEGIALYGMLVAFVIVMNL